MISQIWVRVGDQDDYHNFDSIDVAAEYVHDLLHTGTEIEDGYLLKHTHDLERYSGPALHGVEILGTEFMDNNAISFFWGDNDAQWIGDLDANELDWLSMLLNE